MRSYITLATIRAERQADRESWLAGQEFRLVWAKRYRSLLQAAREREIRSRQGTITQVDESPWDTQR